MARRAAKLCVVFQSLWGRWPCSCFDNRVVRGVNEALLGGTLAVLRWMSWSEAISEIAHVPWFDAGSRRASIIAALSSVRPNREEEICCGVFASVT